MEPSKRDLRIDFIRGLGILTITATHFHWLCKEQGFSSIFKLYTYQSLGFSSAAEIFVFLSGYISSIVYDKTIIRHGLWVAQLRALHRSWQLYSMNIITLFLVIAVGGATFLDNDALMHAGLFDRFAAGGMASFLKVATFDMAPAIFEVLELYIVLLIFTPPVVAAARQAPWLVLAVSLALYGATQVVGGLNLIRGGEPWNFNPFAWQFVFFAGSVCAVALPPMDQWRFPRKSLQMTIVCALLLAACLARITVFKSGHGQGPLYDFLAQWTEKSTVAPLRMAHFILVMWLLLMVVPSTGFILQRPLLRAVAQIGQNSLECFAFSIFCVYAASGLWSLSGGSLPAYWLYAVLCIGAVAAGAQFFRLIKSNPWKSPASNTAPLAGPIRQAYAESIRSQPLPLRLKGSGAFDEPGDG